MRKDARSTAGFKEATERERLRQAVKHQKDWWLTITHTVTFMIKSTTYVLYLPALTATLDFNNAIPLLICAPFYAGGCNLLPRQVRLPDYSVEPRSMS